MFGKISGDKQVGLLIEVAKQLNHYFSKAEYKDFINEIIKMCEAWQKDKGKFPDDLYLFMDNEDDEDLVDIQCDCEGYDVDICDCYIYIVAYVYLLANEYCGITTIPETLDNIDESCYDKIKEICNSIDIIPEDMFDKIEKQFME